AFDIARYWLIATFDATALANTAASFSGPRRTHLVARRAYRLDDVLVAGAAAEVGCEDVEQVLVADVRALLQRVDRQHQEAGRAEAALQAMVRDEGLLQRMQRIAVRQPLDGAD